MTNKVFPWERSFTNQVFRLAIPITIQSLVLSLMQIVDNLMIGQLGEIELAGVTQANRITFLFQITMFGVVSGASVFTAQYWGKRDVRGIRSLLGLGMLTGAGIAVIFDALVLVIPEQLMAILIKDESAVQVGAQYLRIIGFGYLIQAIAMVQAAVLKSTEQVRLPMFASILAIVTNAGLNYLLIFGKFGFPRLGVQGGALATVIGSTLELLLLLFVAYKNQLPTAAKPRELLPTSRDVIPRYYRVVLPVMLNEGFWSLGMVVYSVAYGRMGASTVAAVSIFNNIEQLSSVMLRGMTHACAVMIGMAIGAGRREDAQITAKRHLYGSMMVGAVIGLFVYAFAGNIVSLFNVSPETAQNARSIVRVYAFFVWIQAAACTLIVGILRGGGDVRYAMVLDVLPVWLIGIPIVFAFGPGLGFPIAAVYGLTRLDEIVKSIIGMKRLYSKKWIHNLVEIPKSDG